MDQEIIDEMEFLADTLLYHEYERLGRRFLSYLWLKHLAKERLNELLKQKELIGPGANQLD